MSNRRDFLKDAAGALAGSAAFGGPVSGQEPVPQPDADALTTDRCGADCVHRFLRRLRQRAS